MSATAQNTLHDCRDSWASTITELSAADPRIVVVVNDSVGSSKLVGFQDRFPDRLLNVGIAEQNMVGVAAGLANGGKIPFVSAAACFLTARAMEQIKVDVAYSGYNIKLIGQSPGVAYGELGPTHHSIEDFGWLRTIPGLTIVAPSDPVETAQVIRWAAEHDGPVYVRVPRMGVPDIHPADYTFAAGRASTLRDGDDLTLIATGTVVARSLDAAEQLGAEGVQARVLSMPTVKPLDTAAVIAASTETRGIVTVEEALVTGLGGAVAEVVAEHAPCPVRFVGFRDAVAVTGSAEWLLSRHGIDSAGIADAARHVLGG